MSDPKFHQNFKRLNILIISIKLSEKNKAILLLIQKKLPNKSLKKVFFDIIMKLLEKAKLIKNY